MSITVFPITPDFVAEIGDVDLASLSEPDLAEIKEAFGSPGDIGEVFLTDHLLAFEITSIVLLVAAVGGVVLGTVREEEDTP